MATPIRSDAAAARCMRSLSTTLRRCLPAARRDGYRGALAAHVAEASLCGVVAGRAFAIAAIDIALWDLRGLRDKKPLYLLLGARAKEIPAYGSGVDLPKPLDGLLKQTEGFLARGLPGVKVKIGKADPREDKTRVAAVRKLIGDEVDLMLDANMAWSAQEALERARRLEEFNLYWYEEPTIPEDVAGHARLVRELSVPIAVGESLHSPHEFQRYVDERAAAVVQIDPANGGITASLRALGMANAAGLKASSHYTDELSAHLLCAAAECGVPREARVRAGSLSRGAAARGEGARAADRSAGHRHDASRRAP